MHLALDFSKAIFPAIKSSLLSGILQLERASIESTEHIINRNAALIIQIPQNFYCSFE